MRVSGRDSLRLSLTLGSQGRSSPAPVNLWTHKILISLLHGSRADHTHKPTLTQHTRRQAPQEKRHMLSLVSKTSGMLEKMPGVLTHSKWTRESVSLSSQAGSLWMCAANVKLWSLLKSTGLHTKYGLAYFQLALFWHKAMLRGNGGAAHSWYKSNCWCFVSSSRNSGKQKSKNSISRKTQAAYLFILTLSDIPKFDWWHCYFSHYSLVHTWRIQYWAAVTLCWIHIVYSVDVVHLWTFVDSSLKFGLLSWMPCRMCFPFRISWCWKYSTFRWASFLVFCIVVDPWIICFMQCIHCLLLIYTFHWDTNMTNVFLKNQSPAESISKCCCCEENLIVPVSVLTVWHSYLLLGPDHVAMGCQPKSMKVDETVSCLVTYTDWKPRQAALLLLGMQMTHLCIHWFRVESSTLVWN